MRAEQDDFFEQEDTTREQLPKFDATQRVTIVTSTGRKRTALPFLTNGELKNLSEINGFAAEELLGRMTTGAGNISFENHHREQPK